VGDVLVNRTVNLEFLSGKVMAHDMLLHVLLGQRVIDNPSEARELVNALSAAVRAVRRDQSITERERHGYCKTLEEAITAIEFMASGPRNNG
jgi:hypothetical protein